MDDVMHHPRFPYTHSTTFMDGGQKYYEPDPFGLNLSGLSRIYFEQQCDVFGLIFEEHGGCISAYLWFK